MLANTFVMTSRSFPASSVNSGRVSFSHQVWWVSNDEHRVLMCHPSLFFLISLSLCFSRHSGVVFLADDRHWSVISRNRRRKRHPRHHQVAERRRLCWNWAAAAQLHPRHHQVAERRALGRRCHRYSQDTPCHFFLWTCFDVFSKPRGCYDACATARAGCSAGREWLLHPEGTARAEFFCALRHHHAAEGRRSLAIIAAGFGSGSKLTRRVAVSDLLSLCLSQ